MTDEMRDKRAEWDKEVIAAQPDTSFEGAGVEVPDEFVQFENLTRGLLRVPKKELDEKRREEGED